MGGIGTSQRFLCQRVTLSYDVLHILMFLKYSYCTLLSPIHRKCPVPLTAGPSHRGPSRVSYASLRLLGLSPNPLRPEAGADV